MPIDCNKHCKDEQEVICRLQQQLVKLESQYEEAVQTPQQTQQQIQQKKLLDKAIDGLKDEIHYAAIDHKTCITACELRNRGCESGGGGGVNRKKYSKSRRFRTRRRVRRIRRGRTKNRRSS